MKLEHITFLVIPLAVTLLFWNALYSLVPIVLGAFYFLHARGFFRLMRKVISRSMSAEVPPLAPVGGASDSEPTAITLLVRAPNQILGVDSEAGTGTIFNSFYQRVKLETNDHLRLNKKGRRLAAAKNAMMSRRRKNKQGKLEAISVNPARADMESSMLHLLESRPVYSGKVIKFKSLSPSVMNKYQVGKEVEESGLTHTAESPNCKGRGSHRFFIHCQSGRLLSGSEEGQVALLPGTRFLILSREPWQNPDDLGIPSGYTFELLEVA